MPLRPLPSIELLGEDAVLLRFGHTSDAACNARVHQWTQHIRSQRPPWLRDVVPAYASLALIIDGGTFPPSLDPLAEVSRWLRVQSPRPSSDASTGHLVDIHVHYGGECGPDLDVVAAHSRLSAREVVGRHTAAEYTVAMLGFAPGFPYLLGLDPAIAMARRSTPRTHVAGGSVGIGGSQTGIYPRAGPGGWQIIGRTTQRLFDASREPPALLAPGDRVRFIATDHPG